MSRKLNTCLVRHSWWFYHSALEQHHNTGDSRARVFLPAVVRLRACRCSYKALPTEVTVCIQILIDLFYDEMNHYCWEKPRWLCNVSRLDLGNAARCSLLYGLLCNVGLGFWVSDLGRHEENLSRKAGEMRKSGWRGGKGGAADILLPLVASLENYSCLCLLLVKIPAAFLHRPTATFKSFSVSGKRPFDCRGWLPV